MPVLESRNDAASETFLENRAGMLRLLAGIRAIETRVRDNSEHQRGRFEANGQLLPRDRLELLRDRDAPWLEISTLAGLGMHDNDGETAASGGGCIAGIGFVADTPCVLFANDSAIKAGAITPSTLAKMLRAQEIARSCHLPIIYLVETAGGNLLYQAETFVAGGRQFANQARLSAAGIPQIAIVFGSCTAGGAYIVGLSDYVIAVQGKAKVFLAGPPLLKAATGEVADAQTLGGAEMHGTVSGLADYLAADDADAIRMARDVLARFGWQVTPDRLPRPGADPLYAADELCGVAPIDYRKPYDVREVIARVIDGSDFLEFKERFGSATVCGHGRIGAIACGLISNNGPIDVNGAVKAAQFIQLCSQSGTPIVYLQNTTGFIVGVEAERNGIVKHGSKLIQAMANATVPQLTVHIGASFGAGSYAMCGRSFDPQFIFAWPNNRIGMMGSAQAARVMTIVAEDKAVRTGAPLDAALLAAQEQEIVCRMDSESRAEYASARLWDDGIIDPRDTRRVLALGLWLCRTVADRRVRAITFGVARF
jgi:geranyl-CoA carboxylase beta subunit